ncbi:hypothetical protein [uncultured Megamonas sp.]|uniref:hypothetical protein n=1 Tax=uncultured Megamonas sp. TaxID=286140 RepID=UPI00259BC591|nr:hypothetical protein [uncultured Megamonas sp.]
MLVKELYKLWIIEIEQGNRILTYKNYSTVVVAEYTYKGIIKFNKAISTGRYFDFCNRYRGKRRQGYNRPSVMFNEYDSK